MQFVGAFQRGETITLRFGVQEGLSSVVGLPTAMLKPILDGRIPGPETASLADLLVTPADGEFAIPAGFNVTISSTVTNVLAAGTYATDMRVMLGSGVHKTDTVFFRLIEAVTQ